VEFLRGCADEQDTNGIVFAGDDKNGPNYVHSLLLNLMGDAALADVFDLERRWVDLNARAEALGVRARTPTTTSLKVRSADFFRACAQTQTGREQMT
jgi:hypothetical protein